MEILSLKINKKIDGYVIDNNGTNFAKKIRNVIQFNMNKRYGGLFMAFKGIDFFRLDDKLSKEEKLIKKSVREFLNKEIEPLVKEAFHKEESLPFKDIAPKMGDIGMLGTFFARGIWMSWRKLCGIWPGLSGSGKGG